MNCRWWILFAPLSHTKILVVAEFVKMVGILQRDALDAKMRGQIKETLLSGQWTCTESVLLLCRFILGYRNHWVTVLVKLAVRLCNDLLYNTWKLPSFYKSTHIFVVCWVAYANKEQAVCFAVKCYYLFTDTYWTNLNTKP